MLLIGRCHAGNGVSKKKKRKKESSGRGKGEKGKKETAPRLQNFVALRGTRESRRQKGRKTTKSPGREEKIKEKNTSQLDVQLKHASRRRHPEPEGFQPRPPERIHSKEADLGLKKGGRKKLRGRERKSRELPGATSIWGWVVRPLR